MTKGRKRETWVTALAADKNGEIFEVEGYAAAGMAGSALTSLKTSNTLSLPFGSELMMLPGRAPVLYNISEGRFEILEENPYRPGEPVFPVAAFNSPGYLTTRISAFEETPGAGPLPLFSYGAAGWQGRGFRAATLQVDKEDRQDLRKMPMKKVKAGVRRMQKALPDNRLREHLETCALVYGCPAGKNFFLGRYEAPLPTSRACNARCLGCLSLQQDSGIPETQPRMTFIPSPEEIVGAALAHIRRVKSAVVSFGQGCEGDPLTSVHVIEPAIRMIREQTAEGTINMNTNAGAPDALDALFDAGLDSVRVSMNSVRPECYSAYFRPGSYTFDDVVRSVDLALSRGRFVSVNYLNCPGFTDAPEEAAALEAFLTAYPINMIQWRNLNFDPIRYWQAMNQAAVQGQPMGVERLLRKIRKKFPRLMFGYFNPPKEKFASKN